MDWAEPTYIQVKMMQWCRGQFKDIAGFCCGVEKLLSSDFVRNSGYIEYKIHVAGTHSFSVKYM